jgi:hypothetical protein
VTRSSRVAWIAILVLPVVAVGARWILDAGEEARWARPERERGTTETAAFVWTADGEIGSGARVLARIAALHPDARRQEFESTALRVRYPELAGDPYLVMVELRGEASATLDPSRLTVVDERGTALSAPRWPESTRLDALATILHAPGAVSAGQRASFVLFGRAPEFGAGLAIEGAAPIPLAKSDALPGEGDLPVARVDRRARVDRPGSEEGR